MPTRASFNFSLFLLISFLAFYLMIVPPSTSVAAGNGVWNPYLQQLTDSGVIIQWVTQTGVTATVRYSTDTSYGLIVTGTTRSTGFGTILNRVELSDLQPNTLYYYKVYTDDEELLPGEQLSFQTAPKVGSETPFTFLVFGDFGKGSTTQQLLRDQMLLDTFRFIVTTGDNAYSVGSYSDFHHKVFTIYRELFPRVGLFPALGNHDTYSSNGEPYLDIFDLPKNSWRSSDLERYYSFDFGSVHFAVLDSTSSLNEDDSAAQDDMFDWLRDDLGRTTQNWKIGVFHHSAYSTGSHGSDTDVRAKLVPIFEAYGVDAVFTGHDHIYQRTKPIRAGQITTTTSGGIVYLVSGGGSRVDYWCDPHAEWLAVSRCSQDYGLYNRLSVDGDQITIDAVTSRGTITDTYLLTKSLTVPVDNVSISGPASALINSNLSFVATAQPLAVTAPLTYTWRASNQTTTTSVSGLESKASFRWAEAGPQSITLTVANGWGVATNMYTVTIISGEHQIFLPAVTK